MPSDKLRPDEIDAAIAATQQGRRPGLRLEPDELTPLEADYRLRVRGHADEEKEIQLNDETDGSDIPTYPGRLRPDIAYSDHDGEAADGPRRRRILPKLIAGLALVVFAGIIWWSYGTEPAGEPGSAPLITAEESPAKFRPEDEGGMEVPNQDKLIYSQIGGDSDPGPQVEKLLPPPETPIEPPAPPPSSQAADPATDAAPAATVETMPAESAPADASTAEAAPQPPAAPATPVETSALDETPKDGAEKPAATKPAEPEVTPEVAEAPAEPKPEPEPTAEAPQVAAAVTGGFRVQLAALRTRTAAQTEWDNLQRRFPSLLEELEVNLQRADLGDKGVYYRVQAGPLPDRAAATSLCDRFEEQNQGCLVVAP